MRSEDVVVDVSQDWVLACDVQQRFMHGPGVEHRLRGFERAVPPSSSPQAAIATISCPSPRTAWRWWLAMPRVKGSPLRL